MAFDEILGRCRTVARHVGDCHRSAQGLDAPQDSRGHIYPVAYGYLKGTAGGDGEGFDVWVGSLTPGTLTGVVCTIDLHKRDAELKLLFGCTHAEAFAIVSFLNQGQMAATLIAKDVERR